MTLEEFDAWMLDTSDAQSQGTPFQRIIIKVTQREAVC